MYVAKSPPSISWNEMTGASLLEMPPLNPPKTTSKSLNDYRTFPKYPKSFLRRNPVYSSITCVNTLALVAVFLDVVQYDIVNKYVMERDMMADTGLDRELDLYRIACEDEEEMWP